MLRAGAQGALGGVTLQWTFSGTPRCVADDFRPIQVHNANMPPIGQLLAAGSPLRQSTLSDVRRSTGGAKCLKILIQPPGTCYGLQAPPWSNLS